MTESKQLGLGLVGCGDFGLFCAEAYNSLDGIKMVAAADLRKDLADRIAEQFEGASSYGEFAQMLKDPAVDLVHVATPPSSHYQLVMAALEADKHVLCEKPLSMTAQQGQEMVELARKKKKICPVNFVMRYNQITEAVKTILGEELIGQALSARLTNCASDAKLVPSHWFWDLDVAGGIFVEHGVHFFDLYRYWFGDGEIIGSHAENRPGTEMQDRVTCEVHHANGVISSHFHGFDQVRPLDRTDHRIVCELGDIRIDQWIPITLTVEAVVDAATEARLAEVCPGCSIATLAEYQGSDRNVRKRGKELAVDKLIRLSYTPSPDKQSVYAQSVRDLMVDQLAFINDENHKRVVAEINGLEAIKLAATAAQRAAGS
ncbi:MAG: Gfo/Idh/MocA family protein [Phycisphaerae bacterium]